MKTFDWHADPITARTLITPTYRNTQNARRFFKAKCDDHFKFDVPFAAWMKNGKAKTMGDAVEEWLKREAMPKALRKPSITSFDWHSSPITRSTPVTATYRNTQNVRRFFKAKCGDHFKFDVPFMAWMKNGKAKTMGDAVEEWLKREAKSRPARGSK